MNAKSLLKGIQVFLNHENLKTSPLMYDEEKFEKKVSFKATLKDDDGIFKCFNITVEETHPPVDPERYNIKSELYKNFFDKDE